MAEIEFIESYIKYDGGDYEWSDNHGELVRCKNCNFFSNSRKCMRPMWHTDGSVEYPPRRADDYCSYAEKKDYSTADTPQTDCKGCEHWKYIAHEANTFIMGNSQKGYENDKCRLYPQNER